MRAIIFTLLFFTAVTTTAQPRELDRDRLPQPVYPHNQQLINNYWKAWEEAWKRMDTIQRWEAPPSTLFCKYAPYFFPADRLLDPLYTQPQSHPLAWLEEEYHRLSGDNERMRKIIYEEKSLPAYLTQHEQQAVGDETLPLEQIAREALSALCVARLSEALEFREEAKKHRRQYEQLRQIINKKYWDNTDNTYYDLRDGAVIRTPTPAVFWVMLAEVPSPRQNEQIIEHLFGEEEVTVPADWYTRNDTREVPLVYLATKALNKAGYSRQAGLLAQNFANHYTPSRHTPTDLLAPISLFIEDILGFYRVDATARVVEWRKEQSGLYGIKNLTFGTISTDIIGDEHLIRVESNETYTLIVNGRAHRVRKGSNTFKSK